MGINIKSCSIFILAVMASVEAYAVTRTLTAVRDNTLYEDTAPAAARSNGAGTRIFAGRTGEGTNSIRRALIAFDPSGAAIPSGAVIVSAELTLQMNMSNAGAEDVSIHRVLANWGEGGSVAGAGQGVGAPAQPNDATWFHTFFDGSFWSLPGGDFSASPSATESVGGNGSYTWGSTAQMVADVQSWVDNSSTNFGWMLVGNEFSQPSAKSFDSRESGGGPVLVVTFNAPVPTTSYWVLMLLAVILALLGLTTLRLGSVRSRIP